MRIAVVGATGRIGAKLTRNLLAEGHDVRALSRGGPALDDLVARGAEPFTGSFETDEEDLKAFFQDVDAAFLMVKTDWDNIESHYNTVAQRFVDALQASPVKYVVNLSAMGAEVTGKTGHFEVFHQLEKKLDELSAIDIVHLRAAWFMENTLVWVDSVAKYKRIAWYYEPDLKMPWVAIDDIADAAFTHLIRMPEEHRVVRELGSHELTMREVAEIIAAEIGEPIDYRFIDRSDPHVKKVFLERFGTSETWVDDNRTAAAMNDHVIRFDGDTVIRPPLPTSMAAFIASAWKTAYLKRLQQAPQVESFLTWCAR